MQAAGHDVLDGLLAPTGIPFLRWLVTHLRDSLGMRYAFVGEVTGSSWQQVDLLAMADESGVRAEPHRYEIDGTPCELALRRGEILTYPHDVHTLFPRAAEIVRLGIESYVGMGLVDETGHPLGILAALDPTPRADVDALGRMMARFRARVTAELALRRAVHERDAVIESAFAPTPDQTFETLVVQLAHALQVKIAFVSELLPQDHTRARTLAIANDGVLGEEIVYDVRGTPCGLVYERSVVVHPRGVQALYPHDPYLVALSAEAYMGIAFHDAHGAPIGHVGIIHDRPLNADLAQLNILRLFARLGASELHWCRGGDVRLAVEHRRRETQKTESLGLLAGGVAHDFNNLLVGIMGRATLGLAEQDVPAAIRTHLESIDLAAQRAAELARLLLAYAGRTPSVKQPTDLGAMLREIERLLAASIPDNVRVRYDLADRPLGIDADAAQLRQVAMNLVLNAAEAIGDAPGVVTLRTMERSCDRATLDTVVDGDALAEGRYVCLEVEDTGSGMAREIVEKIFDPFFTTKLTGRGLGLATVPGIIRAHGGGLRVTSTPGVGTTFTVLLPASSAALARPATPAPATDRPWQGRGRVLLVDDDEGVRFTTTEMLRRIGFEVHAASGGEEALRLAEQHDDLRAVLLDLAMPGMSGEETFEALRKHRTDLPVVFMSGYDPADAGKRIRTDDDVRFLQKPFRTQALRSTMAELLEARGEHHRRGPRGLEPEPFGQRPPALSFRDASTE